MPRPRRNPFYVVLGVAGFAFTVTAASSCVAVLRGVRPQAVDAAPHPLERVMDRYGTSLLVGELVVLAIATVGAVGLDQYNAERSRPSREVGQQARPAAVDRVTEP
ncbi:MAG: hypothetical protein ACKO4Z_01635 [Planctomycetota bacterium]|nr:hypothetical protein [Planctomycetota bacterium]